MPGPFPDRRGCSYRCGACAVASVQSRAGSPQIFRASGLTNLRLAHSASTRVHRQLPCPAAGNVESDKAVNHRELATVHKGKQPVGLVKLEIAHGHFTAGNKGCAAGEESKENKNSADKLDDGP